MMWQVDRGPVEGKRGCGDPTQPSGEGSVGRPPNKLRRRSGLRQRNAIDGGLSIWVQGAFWVLGPLWVLVAVVGLLAVGGGALRAQETRPAEPNQAIQPKQTIQAADSRIGFLRWAVPAADLPAGVATVRLQDQNGGIYVAQVGGPWLSDPPPAPADQPPRIWLTFLAPLPGSAPAQEPLQLSLLDADGAAPSQQTLSWVLGNLEAGNLEAASGEASKSGTGDAGVGDAGVGEGTFGQELQWQGQPVLRLMSPVYDGSTPAARDETYKVFHHLWMPNLTEPITKGSGGLFPHHRGLFMGWNRIQLTQAEKAAQVDTWHAKLAHQQLQRELSREAGPVFGRQVIEILWVNEAIQPPQPFLRETRELIVVPIGQQRLVQFNARLESLSGDVVLAGDPQHAGFQFRASQHVADISKEQTYYLRPDGIDRPGSFRNWPDQPQHVDLPFHGMSFVIDDQRLTCVRLEHPQNPGTARFSERDYGRFGSYFEHVLTPAQPLQVRYQLRVVPGELSLPTAQQWQQHFAQPPTIQWLGRSNGSTSDSAPDPMWPVDLPRRPQDLRPLNEQPLFSGEPQAWDASIRERGWILYDEDQYKLWYTGYDGQRTSTKYLGLATSPDGLHWSRSAANPLIPDHWVEDVMVVKHAGHYWLFGEGPNDVAHWFRSRDGERWERMGDLDIRQTDGQPISPGPRGTPTVWQEAGQWYLLYERRDAGIWLATSPDLQVWTHVQDDPVIGLGDRDYDQTMIAVNQVLRTDDGYVCFFHSSSDAAPPRRWVCSAAISRDLRHWTKLPQPLTTRQQNQSSGIVVRGPTGWRFYTMHDRVDAYDWE